MCIKARYLLVLLSSFLLCEFTAHGRTTYFCITASSDAIEGVQNGSFVIQRYYSVSPPSWNSVNVTITGTAQNGVDYTVIPTQITFPTGVDIVTVSVSPFWWDEALEGPETVTMTLDPAQGCYGTGSSATITISEPFKVQVTRIQDAIEPNSAGQGAQNGRFQFSRVSGDLNTALTVPVSITGSAQNGGDYQTLLPIIIPAGQPSILVDIVPLQDAQVEVREEVTLTIDPALASGSARATIYVYDHVPVFTLPHTTFSLYEFGQSSQITINREGILDTQVTVQFTITGVAQNGSDFHYVPLSLTFQPNQTTADIPLIVVQDSLYEGQETATFALTPSSSYGLLDPSSGTIYVGDDDPPPAALDFSFDTQYGANGIVRAIARQADGKIIIGGGFTSVQGQQHLGMARLNIDGTVDPYFNPALGGGDVRALAIDSYGRIIAGGTFQTVSNNYSPYIARINSNGTTDTSFYNINYNNYIFAIAIQNDGKIMVGGMFTTVWAGNMNASRIIRLDPYGMIDTSFYNGKNSGANGSVRAIRLQTVNGQQKVLVGGDFSTVAYIYRPGMARMNPDGLCDTTFTASCSGSVYCIDLDADSGDIGIGGNFTSINGVARALVARLAPNGSVYPSFDPLQGPNAEVRGIAFDYYGRMVIGGRFTSVQGIPRGYIARLTSTGLLDALFNPGTGFFGADTSYTEIEALLIDPAGRVCVGETSLPTMGMLATASSGSMATDGSPFAKKSERRCLDTIIATEIGSNEAMFKTAPVNIRTAILKTQERPRKHWLLNQSQVSGSPEWVAAQELTFNSKAQPTHGIVEDLRKRIASDVGRTEASQFIASVKEYARKVAGRNPGSETSGSGIQPV